MKLTFDDALRIARSYTDYGGIYRSNDEHYEIYQHGIQTVITALTAASNRGLDTQTAALHAMKTTEHGKTEDDFNAEQAKTGGMPYGTYGGY